MPQERARYGRAKQRRRAEASPDPRSQGRSDSRRPNELAVNGAVRQDGARRDGPQKRRASGGGRNHGAAFGKALYVARGLGAEVGIRGLRESECGGGPADAEPGGSRQAGGSPESSAHSILHVLGCSFWRGADGKTDLSVRPPSQNLTGRSTEEPGKGAGARGRVGRK